MRQLTLRPVLPLNTKHKLIQETKVIANSNNKKDEAASRYKNARKSDWFAPVIVALRDMAGPGERCMYCSGSEAGEVEHFKPKSHFPIFALSWKNLLWVCGICNRNKSEYFPTTTNGKHLLIDPTKENPWNYFFIDEFGNLSAKWDNAISDLNMRAVETIARYGLDREAIQICRQTRLIDLASKANDSICLFNNGALSIEDLRLRLSDWLAQPFQSDVADYFLNGPGRSEEPFFSFFNLLQL